MVLIILMEQVTAFEGIVELAENIVEALVNRIALQRHLTKVIFHPVDTITNNWYRSKMLYQTKIVIGS